MPVTLGIDLGTTTIAALALDTDTGAILAHSAHPNDTEITSPTDKARGYSEWDALRIAGIAFACLGDVRQQLGDRVNEAAGIGITGQQHGAVIPPNWWLDPIGQALMPPIPRLIGWQDRRAAEVISGTEETFLARALRLAGEDASTRTGCRLAAGYLAVTLFWLKETGRLRGRGRACFLPDYFAGILTDAPPASDPTLAASSGAFDVTAGDWDTGILEALGLPRERLPQLVPSGSCIGGLGRTAATATGLPVGLRVFAPLGDNQASFLGSVSDRAHSVFVNVGTGGQVSAAVESFHFDPRLETRPLPGGFLLVCAGLSGGRAYATLERFFQKTAEALLDLESGPLYAAMNRLAAAVPAGAEGLRCEPFFTGTRLRPELRASFTGVSSGNFTPAHLTRALLEGMARSFREGYDMIRPYLSEPPQRLIGAGNGIRENQLLAHIIADEFGLPVSIPAHREEAAYGAALSAAVGAGILRDWESAGRLIGYGN
jgi:sugar (pentulose or hexulose) kinase